MVEANNTQKHSEKEKNIRKDREEKQKYKYYWYFSGELELLTVCEKPSIRLESTRTHGPVGAKASSDRRGPGACRSCLNTRA